MATFAFKAVDLAGVPQNGELDAGDKQTVAQELRGKGWSSSTSRSSSPRARATSSLASGRSRRAI